MSRLIVDLLTDLLNLFHF